MATNRRTNAGTEQKGRIGKPKTARVRPPRPMELWDRFRDPCPFSVMRNEDGSFRIEAGELEGAVTLFSVPADGIDDEGWCDAKQTLMAATGLKHGEFTLHHFDLQIQSMFLPYILGSIIIGYRLRGGRGCPPAKVVAKQIGFPLPMVRAGLEEYKRVQG